MALTNQYRSVLAAAVIVVAIGASSSLAQTAAPSVQSRVVPAGYKRQLGFFTSLNPDCTPTGDIVARILTKPKNGVAELDQGLGYPNFGSANQRYRCNQILVEGYRINYMSKNDFAGHDELKVEFFTPNGQQVIWKYAIAVR